MPRFGAVFCAGLALFGSAITAPGIAEGVGALVPLAGPAAVPAAHGHPPEPHAVGARSLLQAAAVRPQARPDQPPFVPGALAPDTSPRPALRDTWDMPRLLWDGHPRGSRWSAAVMAALRGPGAPLLEVVPRDIAQWCPGYPQADDEDRAAFWAGLVSTLAWQESTHDPRAVGGGGQWYGLVQIAPDTARWRNCAASTAEALLDGPANLSCGIRIMAVTVPRDGVIARDMQGVAADWGPFHSPRKREEMRNWVRGQDYCQSRTRPILRPEREAPAVTDTIQPRMRPNRAILPAPDRVAAAR